LAAIYHLSNRDKKIASNESHVLKRSKKFCPKETNGVTYGNGNGNGNGHKKIGFILQLFEKEPEISWSACKVERAEEIGGFFCEICGSRLDIQGHHILKREFGGKNISAVCMLLCKECHHIVDNLKCNSNGHSNHRTKEVLDKYKELVIARFGFDFLEFIKTQEEIKKAKRAKTNGNN
jgi:5-methylcytosine-specific restriction endonuclease McrA